MKCKGCVDLYSELIIILDAEACVLDTRTALVNCLGVVANLDEDILYSPWKETLPVPVHKADCSESLNQQYKGALAFNAHQRNTPSKYPVDIHQSEGSKLDIKDHTESPVCSSKGISSGSCSLRNSEENPNLHLDVQEETDKAEVEDLKEVFLSRLRSLIPLIRKEGYCPKQSIEEALAVAEYLYRRAGKFSGHKFTSFSESFKESSLVGLRIKDSEVSDFVFPKPDAVALITPYETLVRRVIAASYDGADDLNIFSDPIAFVNRLCAEASLEIGNYRITLVLVSHGPDSVQHLIDIGGFKHTSKDRLVVETAHVDDLVHKYIKSSKETKYLLYPSESRITQYILGFPEFANKDVQLLERCPKDSALSTGIISDAVNAQKTATDKVDLSREPQLDSLKELGAVYIRFNNPVLVEGTVVKGFGRGASFLGIPTANLNCDTIPHLIPGVYFGSCWLANNKEVEPTRTLQTILSIGFNPHFDDDTYSVEPYIYHRFQETLLGQRITLSIEGFLRTEARFTSVQGLVAAIQQDIVQHKLILRAQNGSH